MVGVVARVLVVALIASVAMVPIGTSAAEEGAAQGTSGVVADSAAAHGVPDVAAISAPSSGSASPVSLAGGVQALDLCPAAGEVDTGFADVAGNTHKQTIECLVWAEITQGIAPGVFDPSGAVTRGQMASFLVRMLAAHGVELEAVPLAFSDVEPDAAHADAIARLVGAGITQGVDSQRFAPGAVVTRGQMASFLTRTVELVVESELPADAAGFDDIATSMHREAISKAAAVGLTGGVSADRFDPGAEVRRDQMASFLARTLSYLAVNDPGLELPAGLLPGAEPTSSGTPEPRPGIVEFELGEDTVEVEEPQEATLVDDTLTIAVDELAEPEPGEYLVSYASEALPFGLHHRVVEVARSGDRWVIELVGAELWEPYEELELDVTVAPDEESMADLVDAINEQAVTATEPVFTATLEDPASTAGAQLADAGVTVPRAFEGPTISLTLQEPHPDPRRRGQFRDGITVYEDTQSGGRIALDLEMALQPTLNLAFDGGGWFSGPDYAFVSMRLDADVDVGFTATSGLEQACDLAADESASGDECPLRVGDHLDRALAQVPTDALEVLEGARSVLRLRQLANSFPTTVSVEPTFPLSVELNAEGLIEASISSWVEIGAEYDSDNGLSGVLLYPGAGDPDEPRVDITGQATATARAQAGVGLRVLIANTFGPTVSGNVFGEVTGGARLQRLSDWPDTAFFDAWATARVGLNAKAEVGVQDPVFGRLSTSWTIYDRDVATFDLYRSTPGAPLLRTVGDVDGNRLTLAWTEPTHATRYLIAAGPTRDSCRLEAQFGTRPQGAQRLLSRQQTPATIALPDVDWDDIHLCIAAVDGTLDRTSPASDTVIVQRSDDDDANGPVDEEEPGDADQSPPNSAQQWTRVAHDEAVFGGDGSQEMRSVTAGGPGLVAVGVDGLRSAVWTSTDGIEWQRVAHDEAVFGDAFSSAMSSVTAGGPSVVAVGHAISQDAAAVWTSTDGIEWQRVAHDEAVFGGDGLQTMSSVTAGGPGLVAVGYDDGRRAAAVWTSTDGIEWQRVAHDEAVFDDGWGRMSSVTAGGPGLVAVGSGQGAWQPGRPGTAAAAWTSADGLVWERAAHDEAVFGGDGLQTMSSVTAGGPGLVAVGYDADSDVDGQDAAAAAWTSADGLVWERVAHDEAVFGGDIRQVMSSVTAGGPGLVAVGYDRRPEVAALLTQVGAVWTSP